MRPTNPDGYPGAFLSGGRHIHAYTRHLTAKPGCGILFRLPYNLTRQRTRRSTCMPSTGGDFGKSASHKQCTAMSRRSGEQCKGIAVKGSPNQKCRMHGGNADVGVDASSFKSGRFSRYLPAQLDELYREALSNPDLLELAEAIALLEARIKSVLAESAGGDPAPKWGEIRDLFAEVETAYLGGKPEEIIAAFEQLHKALDAGMKWDRTWDTVTDTMEQLRKVTDTEVKRKKELNQMVPVERVVILMAAVGQAVKRHVTNPLEIEAVYRELAMLHGNETAGGRPRVGPEVIDVTSSKPKGSKRALTVGA